MSVTTDAPFPDPDPAPNPESLRANGFGGDSTPDEVMTESFDSVVAIFDGPGDTTVRPVRPSLRPYLNWHPRPERPPSAEPPGGAPGSP